MFEILFFFGEIDIKLKITHLYRKAKLKKCKQLKKDFTRGIQGKRNKGIYANYILYYAEI